MNKEYLYTFFNYTSEYVEMAEKWYYSRREKIIEIYIADLYAGNFKKNNPINHIVICILLAEKPSVGIPLWCFFSKEYANEMEPYAIRKIYTLFELPVNLDEVWEHEIENPWSFTIDCIAAIAKQGIAISAYGPGEVGMGGPLTAFIELNGKEISMGGPLVVDDQFRFLCGTQWQPGGGAAVVLDLKTGRLIRVLHRAAPYLPYRFEKDKFIVLLSRTRIKPIDMDLERNEVFIKNIQEFIENPFSKRSKKLRFAFVEEEQ